MNPRIGNLDRRLFFAYVACSLAAIFYLPGFVPVQPATAQSYVFGYNNKAGVVILMLCVVLGAFWTGGLNFQRSSAADSRPVSRKVLLWSLAGMSFGCLAMYLFAGRFGGFGESLYFVDRSWLAAQGKLPYVDFEWTYGPFLLYGPVLLARLFSIGIAPAYYLFWVLNSVCGVLLLYAVVNRIDYPTAARRSIFLLLYVMGLLSILCMGTNYTYLRYMCPLLSVLEVYRLVRVGNPRAFLLAAGWTVAATAILLAISPETAIAHTFACVCIFLLQLLRGNGRSWLVATPLAIAVAAVFFTAARLHELDMLVSAGSGANSLPIAFAPHILLYFAVLFLCACYAVRQLALRRIDDNTAVLLVYSLPMIVPSLGRCDSGHVFWNGIGFYIAVMFYLSNDPAAWKRFRTALVTLMLVVLASNLLFYVPLIHAVVRNHRDPAFARAAAHVDLAAVYPSWHGDFVAPFGYKPNGIGSLLSNQVDYGRYEALLNADRPVDMQEKISEFKDQPAKAILLPEHFDQYCQPSLLGQRIFLSVLFAFPYLSREAHPQSIVQPICDAIQENYRMEQPPSEANFHYSLWVPDPHPRATQ